MLEFDHNKRITLEQIKEKVIYKFKFKINKKIK